METPDGNTKWKHQMETPLTDPEPNQQVQE